MKPLLATRIAVGAMLVFSRPEAALIGAWGPKSSSLWQSSCTKCYISSTGSSGRVPAFAFGHSQRLRRCRMAPPWRQSDYRHCCMSQPGHDGDGGDGSGGDEGVGSGGRVARGGSGSFGSDDKSGEEDREGVGAKNAAALERLFSKPAAETRRQISEGLGRGKAPSPQQRVRLQQENLELRWNMAGKRNQTVCCRECAGEGKCQCRFCDGTGMFKIGGDLMVHPIAGRPPDCPVCKRSGVETCKRCKGAGRIAAWLFKSGRAGG